MQKWQKGILSLSKGLQSKLLCLSLQIYFLEIYLIALSSFLLLKFDLRFDFTGGKKLTWLTH